MKRLANPTIFIVDDDESLLGIHVRPCQAISRNVFYFRAPEDCLAALDLVRPDCIVSDLQMPGMNGAELLGALRASGCSAPAIIVTSAAFDDPAVAAARLAGAHAVVSKGGAAADLVPMIEQLLTDATPD